LSIERDRALIELKVVENHDKIDKKRFRLILLVNLKTVDNPTPHQADSAAPVGYAARKAKFGQGKSSCQSKNAGRAYVNVRRHRHLRQNWKLIYKNERTANFDTTLGWTGVDGRFGSFFVSHCLSADS
jgi:hypothetical protein